MDGLTRRLGDQVQGELRNALQHAAATGEIPALGTMLRGIGESAILLLPLLRFRQAGLAVAAPVFLLLAARHIWDFVVAQLADRRPGYQAAISGRLALLGNRVGSELETEVRRRLGELHGWQQQSIRAVADQFVEERVGLF
jgi:hypothetical protein